jgi:hypothetical protein
MHYDLWNFINKYEGKSKNIRTFDILENHSTFKKNLSTLFQNILPLRLRTFAIFVGALYSRCEPWRRPMFKVLWNSRYQSRPGLIFISSKQFFQFLKQIKVTGGEAWAIRRVWKQLPFVRVDNLHCSYGGMGGGVIVKKTDIFLC